METVENVYQEFKQKININQCNCTIGKTKYKQPSFACPSYDDNLEKHMLNVADQFVDFNKWKSTKNIKWYVLIIALFVSAIIFFARINEPKLKNKERNSAYDDMQNARKAAIFFGFFILVLILLILLYGYITFNNCDKKSGLLSSLFSS